MSAVAVVVADIEAADIVAAAADVAAADVFAAAAAVDGLAG